jgi:hypothetical protein
MCAVRERCQAQILKTICLEKLNECMMRPLWDKGAREELLSRSSENRWF